jgi:Rrf2 family nitric oxide-sensitive transcriptional repressor
MMLPQTAEYALRAVIWLASHPDSPQTKDEMARAADVPPRYFYKVLQALGRAGIVRSQPGPGGGYKLARPADQMTILDVVNVVGPVQRIHSCPLGIESHNPTLCPLHRELDKAFAQIEAAFGRVTIGQLVGKRSCVPPLRQA